MQRLGAALGLALLYASAYFLPLLNPYALYFVPAFYDFVLFPSLISVLVLVPLFLYISSARVTMRARRVSVFCGAVLLIFIAAKSLLDAAGFPWTSLLTLYNRGSAVEQLQFARWARLAIVGLSMPAAAFGVFLLRQRLPQLLRFLSTLGYAFVCLAIYRCASGELQVHPLQRAVAQAEVAPLPPVARRVVWVIFDEMDYHRSLGTEAFDLPNFARLRDRGVTATEAYTPGRDTLYSVPALLSGIAVKGIELSRRQALSLTAVDGASVPFDTAHSVFGRLPGGVQSASVLGFYHPYCRILTALRACHSSYLGNAGRWFDSLVFFSDAGMSVLRFLKWPIQYMPEVLLRAVDPMYRATDTTLALLGPTLADLHSAFDFIHLNVPHLPNVYAQRLLRQQAVDQGAAYRQNLQLADRVLGTIVTTLQAQSGSQKILLIVSSDHWLRTASSTAAPVPFTAWLVGAGVDQAQVLTAPLSTVHTATLAIDFLDGTLDSQAAIANALAASPFSPTWLAPDNYRYY
ncbi:hypothetical protein [Massilia sp. PWRC2]|uniref:hypothetical protein n=1 Tax=Massilia sp. PWRC2 TaxID=2804626 RepID=UPI003CEB7782